MFDPAPVAWCWVVFRRTDLGRVGVAKLALVREPGLPGLLDRKRAGVVLARQTRQFVGRRLFLRRLQTRRRRKVAKLAALLAGVQDCWLARKFQVRPAAQQGIHLGVVCQEFGLTELCCYWTSQPGAAGWQWVGVVLLVVRSFVLGGRFAGQLQRVAAGVLPVPEEELARESAAALVRAPGLVAVLEWVGLAVGGE